MYRCISRLVVFFFFNESATTAIYTLSLYDALPICGGLLAAKLLGIGCHLLGIALTYRLARELDVPRGLDRKSTRLNSSHSQISYAVFCLKKKNNLKQIEKITAYHYTLQSSCATLSP